MNREARKRIAIFGGSGFQAGEGEFEAARQLGAAVAARGWAVVNGGYGGAMLASAVGAAEAGGHVIGVTCRLFKSSPNDYIHEVVEVEDLHTRLRRLIELGDAYVALPGSTGTLAELAMVWELVNKRLIPPRPILCWGDFWRPVVGVFENDGTGDPRFDTRNLPDRRGELITFVSSPAHAVEAIERGFDGVD